MEEIENNPSKTTQIKINNIILTVNSEYYTIFTKKKINVVYIL